MANRNLHALRMYRGRTQCWTFSLHIVAIWGTSVLQFFTLGAVFLDFFASWSGIVDPVGRLGGRLQIWDTLRAKGLPPFDTLSALCGRPFVPLLGPLPILLGPWAAFLGYFLACFYERDFVSQKCLKRHVWGMPSVAKV